MKRRTTIRLFLGIVLAAIVAIVLFAALFDWNQMRPYINRTVSEATGREFVIGGDLAVRLQPGLDGDAGWRRYVPRLVVSAQDVRLSNPAWSTAGKQMATIKRVDAGLRILPLLDKTIVITNLRIDEPQVALQRRKDGSNSWTLKDNGPSQWSVRIDRLAFSGGALRFVDDMIGLDMHASARSIDGNGAAPAVGVQPYGIAFTLGGTYNRTAVTGSGKLGAVLTLGQADKRFPIDASADIGGNKIALLGSISDPTTPSGMDLQLRLAGPSMAELYPLTGVVLPATPPFETHGRLVGMKGADGYWTLMYKEFSGKVGASDIGGTLAYVQRHTRPLLRGELMSRQLRLADLGPAVGANTGNGTRQAGKVKAAPAGKALPVDPFHTDKWGAMDADVTFTGKRLLRTNDIPLENVTAEMHLKDKILKLTPLRFAMAGGQISANLALDGSEPAIHAQARLAARHLKIRQLLPKLETMHDSFGEIHGDAVLTGTGNSVAAMLASSNGELSAVVTKGSISQFMLEMAGLNVANAIAAKLFGDKQVNLNCLVANTVVRNGRANIRQFVIDTDNAVIDVSGYVDMAQERLDLDVQPKTKGSRIFTLRTPLYAKGTFANPEVGPYKTPIAVKAGAAIALAVIAPLAGVLPLINVDQVPDTDCAKALAKK